ncbi:MAG TPA: hypothetical protein ENN80_03695, partial [Candidatus Hydrogenedentes bacterium]|nr:hypothetical protein [Candidatus Hydrogenedentota bacterium]
MDTIRWTSLALVLISVTPAMAWQADFARQPLAKRPKLEVRYTDGARIAFEILAEAYHLVGSLRAPQRLYNVESGDEWLHLSVTGADGRVYSMHHAKDDSRINLYRRGPYFCEVHWLDVQVATKGGRCAPLKGDLALYCYSDKLLASITWHATEDFAAENVAAHGMVGDAAAPGCFDAEGTVRFTPKPFAAGSKQTFAFPLFGETPPLAASAFENLDAVAGMRYDVVRGCYTIGSLSTGGFQGHFYDHPNRYERAAFRVANDGTPRTIYICHENTGGDRGSVEGGVLLDVEGHPLPIVVQISKNFAGEKEEEFYNPDDTPFSETYFPLVLAPHEERALESL